MIASHDCSRGLSPRTSVIERLRRDVVRLLLAEEGTWSVDTLAAEITTRETDVDRSDVDEETRKQAVVALLHRDFPKPAAAGVVTFDVTNETAARGENIADLDPLVCGDPAVVRLSPPPDRARPIAASNRRSLRAGTTGYSETSSPPL